MRISTVTTRRMAPVLAAMAVATGSSRAEPSKAIAGRQIAYRDLTETGSSTAPPEPSPAGEQTLFSGKVDHGGYGAPEMKVEKELERAVSV